MKSPTKIAKFASLVGLFTLISRVLGYVRDMITANMFGAGFGAGIFADAFYIAFRIPNLLRNLLGEGALSASFIPVFTEYLAVKDKRQSRELVNILFTILFIVLALLTILGIFCAPLLVRIIAPGFINTPEKFALTVTLTRIMFPFMFAIGMAALILGVLNSNHRFIIPVLAPCMLSISQIFFVLFVCPLMALPIQGLAIGVLVGGFAQLLFQVPALVKSGYMPSFKLVFNHPGVRKVALLMLPATIGFSVYQINIFIDNICASFLQQGSVSVLYYANRLMQLPLALFGISIATVTLPSMSRSVVNKNIAEVRNILSSGLRMIFFTIIPASVGLMILSKPIIRLLFERGQFTSQATEATAITLLFYCTGLFAYAGVKILASAFYAFQDTITPVKIAAIAMVLNAVLNVILMRFLGVGGLALATAISSVVNMSLLLVLIKRELGAFFGAEILKPLLKIIIASSGMALCCWYALRMLAGVALLVKVGVVIFGGVIIFLLLAYLLKIEEMKYIKRIIFSSRESDL